MEEFLEEQKARLKPRTYSGYEDAIDLFEYFLNGYACNSLDKEESKLYDKLYEGETQILSGVLIFTLLSILLSSLGLIGLVSYSTEAKTKEIAIRKVFGIETREIMVKLNLSILKLFLPGMVIGGFTAWLIMREWLKDFVKNTSYLLTDMRVRRWDFRWNVSCRG